MAKFTPASWRCSAEGRDRFRQMTPRVVAIVRSRVRKYNLSAHTADDLAQEGMLAAAYAVDTWIPERGNIDGYISRVVTNALAMVAAEALTQSRQPYKQVMDLDGTWRRVPVSHAELEHETATDDNLGEVQRSLMASRELGIRSNQLAARLALLKLSDDARRLLELRLRTPAELWIMARNLNQGRMKVDANSVCRYLGWLMLHHTVPDRIRYQRAAREIRDQFRCVLGVDDNTFEALVSSPAPTLPVAKQRPLQELRA